VKFPILVSYAYARKDLVRFRELIERPYIDVLLDSGAFTAKNAGQQILLKDYCRFLDEWSDKLFRYLALDVVGDPIATNANLQEMLQAGYKPVPVHVLGDDQSRMDELFEMSDLVACAGLRRPHKGSAPKEYVAAKMKWAAGRNVHWLGYVREPMIAAFQPYSCDSASWVGTMMYGKVDLYLGRGRWIYSTFDNKEALLNSHEGMQRIRQLGLSVRDVYERNCWRLAQKEGFHCSRFLALAVTADSWVRYVIDIGKRYNTRLFLATVMPQCGHEHLLQAIDRHADKLHLDTLHV